MKSISLKRHYSWIALILTLSICYRALGFNDSYPIVYHKRELLAFSKLSDEQKENLRSTKSVNVSGNSYPLTLTVAKELSRAGFNVHQDKCDDCGVTVEVVRDPVRYWRILMHVLPYQQIVKEEKARPAKDFYADSKYTITVKHRSIGKPLLIEGIALVVEAVPKEADPEDIPNEQEYGLYIASIISATLGNFGLVESYLSDIKQNTRKHAIRDILSIENPNSVQILENQLQRETSKEIQSKLKKAIKSLQD